MAFYDVSLLARDQDFLSRVSACYAQETPLGQLTTDPHQWAVQHQWDLASAPGFGDAYASALASDNPAPGQDPSVITDPQILSAVQTLMNTGAPVVEPPPEVEPQDTP